ncbi:MAG: hypothetical protein GY798_10015 [Hyphomicrobiales bacterium]|nr:hypothetical protein [Hyphomicrobiales bacterium]
MIELSADTFHQAMAANPMVACILHHGAFDSAAEEAAAAADSRFVWTRIDVDSAPSIAAMFRVAENEPYLLVMREGVVLYCEPLCSTSPEATTATVIRAAQLDMAEVRRQVDESRLGRDSLFNRRACPTTWRKRAH